MKNWWFKFLPLLFSALCLFSTLFIISCDSEENKIVCRLSTLQNSFVVSDDEDVTLTATQEFVYNAENKIESILVHAVEGDDPSEVKTSLEYNDKGLVVKMVSFNLSSPEEVATIEIIYDSNDKPQEVHKWYADNDLSGPPYSVSTFSHDTKGRLTTRKVFDVMLVIDERFEYNNDDNVTKKFLGSGAEEHLYLENLSFDNKLKFYGLAPELATLYVYAFYHDPGKNNPLTARVLNKNQAPADVTFTLTYDESGRIISNHASPPDYTNSDFDEASYTCR